MVAEDSDVRLLEAIIEKMNVRTLGFTHSQVKDTRRKAYDPEDMFKLAISMESAHLERLSGNAAGT